MTRRFGFVAFRLEKLIPFTLTVSLCHILFVHAHIQSNTFTCTCRIATRVEAGAVGARSRLTSHSIPHRCIGRVAIACMAYLIKPLSGRSTVEVLGSLAQQNASGSPGTFILNHSYLTDFIPFTDLSCRDVYDTASCTLGSLQGSGSYPKCTCFKMAGQLPGLGSLPQV